MSIDTIAQIFIGIFGVSSILLVAKKNKWGFILGMCSQPFWYITSIAHRQWGIVVLSIFYTFSWGLGIYEWFFVDKRKRAGEVKK